MNNNLTSGQSIAIEFFQSTFDETPYSISELLPGVSSMSYRVASPNRDLIVRLEYKRSMDVIKDEIFSINELSIDNKYVPNLHTHVRQMDNFHVWCRNYIEGESLYDSGPDKYDFKSIGKILSSIHNQSIPIKKHLRRDIYSFVYNDNPKELNIVWSKAKNHKSPQTLNIAEQACEYINSHKLDKYRNCIGFVHGDFNPCNIICGKNDYFYVIDWDKSGRGDILFDLGLSIFYLLFMNNIEFDLGNYLLLIKGYFGSNNLESSVIKKNMELVSISAHAFILNDIKNSVVYNDYSIERNVKRERIFKNNCLPAFLKFKANYNKLEKLLH